MTAKSILSMNFTIGQRELESSEPLTTAEQIDLFSKTRDENLKAAASWEKVGRSDFSVMHMKVAESLAKEIIALQAEKCCCFEIMGDNPNCPIHGNKQFIATAALGAPAIVNGVSSKDWFDSAPEIGF